MSVCEPKGRGQHFRAFQVKGEYKEVNEERELVWTSLSQAGASLPSAASLHCGEEGDS